MALAIAAVNILTSFFHLENDEQRSSRRNAHKPWTNSNTRDNGTTTDKRRMPAPQDFLNCDREDSPCSYFFPTEFYDESSYGYPYRNAAQAQLYGIPNRTLHANWVRFTSVSHNMDFTYIHVRKAGGNTMYDFAKQLEQQYNDTIEVEIMPSVPVHRLVQTIGEEKFIQQMKEMVKQTTFFTFVRDPISRFVSAVGQIADKKPHVLNAIGCLFPEDPTREMTCVLENLIRNKVVNDHLTSASIELYQMMFGIRNVRVAVFPLDRMNDFMKQWDMEPFRRNEAVGIKTRYSTNLLSDDMIRNICRVYEADVYMIQLLGMSVTQCDPHIIMTTQT